MASVPNKPKVTVVDYGMGNIYSVVKALEKFDAEVILSADLDQLREATALVLPGDGAFKAAMANLENRELLPVLRRHVEDKKWLFGICVGFQLLFEESEEFGSCQGFGFFPGKVKRFQGDFTIPHMGWNQVSQIRSDHPLLRGVPENANFYFIHSYYASCQNQDVVFGQCEYFTPFTAIVGRDKLFGTQFHPEKSHENGLKIIENFVQVLREEESWNSSRQ